MSSSTRPSAVLREIFTRAAVYYTVIALFLCTVLLFTVEDASRAISPLSFLLVFPFALCFSVANFIDRKTSLPAALKVFLHFLLTVGGFFCFLYLPAFSGAGESRSLVVLFVFVVCYLIVFGAILLFRNRWKKELQAESDYTPQFSDKASDNRQKKNGFK